MKSRMFGFWAAGFLLAVITGTGYSWSKPLIIDHTCVDTSKIPANWVDSVQAKLKWHYAHTSHGSQLMTGLDRIESGNAAYNVSVSYNSLPTTAGAFCILDGQLFDTYITPDEYWETGSGMNYTRTVLDSLPALNLSMWSWCTQVEYYSQAQVQAYLDSMTKLETEYPNITFIYMTGNAQATGSGGYNRHMNNQLIRQYCKTNNKVLFDFADLDAWWYNGSTWEFNSYTYSDSTIPVEHTHFNGNEAGHTTNESCEQKGKAVWWMMATLAGWNYVGIEENSNIKMKNAKLTAFPNPFTLQTVISNPLTANSNRIRIYDMGGRLVEETTGNVIGKNLMAGMYFVKVGNEEPIKIIKLK